MAEKAKEGLDTMEFILSFWFLLGIPCAILSGVVASSKNHSPLGCGVVGFFFSVLGLIAAAGLGDNRHLREERPWYGMLKV